MDKALHAKAVKQARRYSDPTETTYTWHSKHSLWVELDTQTLDVTLWTDAELVDGFAKFEGEAAV